MTRRYGPDGEEYTEAQAREQLQQVYEDIDRLYELEPIHGDPEELERQYYRLQEEANELSKKLPTTQGEPF